WVSGAVTDANGQPLRAVSGAGQGTTNGTTTDAAGRYSLDFSNWNAALPLYDIGAVTQAETVADQRSINVTLVEDVNVLDELIVVGYGTQKKKLVTGATIQVDGEDLQRLSTASVLGALQSQSPGVQITQSSGQPGEAFKVTIRGLGTIGNSSPLYVIDGVPGGDINTLNPSDIASVDVLKDAAS